MNRVFIIVVALFGVLASGCYKGTDFINPVYSCDCGQVEFNGTEVPLKMAEIVVPDSLEPLSRSYHIVADLRTDEEINAHVDAHDLTFHFSFEVLDDVVYYIQQDDVLHNVQEINHGDPLMPIRNYQATEGSIVIDPAYSGGDETVEFNLTLRESVNGSLVGTPVTMRGTFTDFIE